MISCKLVVLSLPVALTAAIACSASSSGPAERTNCAATNSCCEDYAIFGYCPDAGSVLSSTSSRASDAGSGSGSASTGKAVSCFEITTTATIQRCQFMRQDTPDFACPAPYAGGTCPQSSLYGCCVSSTLSGAYTDTIATCYYDDSQGSAAKAACTGSWTTVPP
jgi:hypothetical protein